MNKRLLKIVILFATLLPALVVAAMVSLSIGATDIPVKDIVGILLRGSGTPAHSILTEVRLPRIILAFAVGGSLSLAGAILQGMFRNPLVSPYTLGISGGASLGVCLTIVCKLYLVFGVIAYPISGFIGAALTILIVYSLSAGRGRISVVNLLLMGVMVSFISSSFQMLLMAMSRAEDLSGIVFWIMGSLDEPNLKLIAAVVACSLTGLAIAYIYIVDLNALALGEDEAVHLCVNLERTRKILFLIASILTGAAVSVAGIIGFVGLVVPHFIRMLTGSDHRILFAGSFLAGAIFLILCDTMARTVIAPLELPVGVITGIVGGAVFIIALSRRRVRL